VVPHRAGFTVVELLAGVGMAAVLAGVGGVQLVTLVHGMRLAGAARTLATDLRLARGHAMAASVTVDVLLDATAGTWEARERGGTTLETRMLPPGVAFAALPARGRLRFDALGTADNGTVALAAAGSTRSVVVNQRGRVRVQ
jgi:general secretion pathway protein H